MLFSSMTFIYVFLPVLLVIYFLSKPKWRNNILLIASIIFYAWGNPKYVLIMLSVILISYFGALSIEKFSKNKKIVLFLTVILNLSFLFYFKYFDFLINNINSLFKSNIDILNIALPVGISFYTFQALSYVFDVYRNEVKAQNNIYNLALYICLFPQLVAGPIIKYHDIENQIKSREINFDKVNTGAKRFIAGLAKKVLIANTLGNIADKIFSQSPDMFSSGTAWIGALSYTFQIYFDFSGYSDMAIGLGLIFGFGFMENFNYPYISKSITEFWRRWHISLSTWFKQYVYISLGGNKEGIVKTCRNLGIVFLLTGIWHGANWTFVLWGIWHGAFIITEKILNIKEYEKKAHSPICESIRHLYCILAVVIGWVIFRSDNINYACKYIMNMFGLLHLNISDFIYENSYYADNLGWLMMFFAILCSIPLFKNIAKVENKCAKILVNTWFLILFLLSTISIASNTYNPFIYFNF